ncbi:MAG: DUF2778 domain-containing protein [Alphaproteobacteria bacterium]|nr:DUF2778 domain-containing protein [Alphaproteobacteria bacterium]
MYEKYKSPFGYQVGDNGIDSYGVDHSGFTLRDEIEYQTARDNRESQMMQMYNQQGIMENYPQYTTNFWGYVGNNYGFGSSNISSAISTHPAMNTTPTPLQTVQTQIPQAQTSVSSINSDPNCYIEFNGQDVDLYKYGQNDGTRLQNGQLQNNLSGQSGGDDYQSRIYQDVPDKGPIPEGTYYANQNQRQNITFADALIGTGVKALNGIGIPINRGKWKGGPISWGTSRVWLRPDANTNTYGRSGFSIHGGLTKGSAGCIDIPWQTGKLNNYLDNCQDSVPVYVKYPDNW